VLALLFVTANTKHSPAFHFRALAGLSDVC
jgi:hypothetical protein